MGEDVSGLFYYYRSKLRGGALLSGCDLLAIDILREQRSAGGRIWDVGSGVGQVSAMLALDGWTVVAVDRDPKRFATLRLVAAVVARLDAAAGARMTPKFETFPDVILGEEVADDIGLVLGCSFVGSNQIYNEFNAGLRRFRGVLVDFPRLFVGAEDPAEWRPRAARYCQEAAGLQAEFFPCTVPAAEGAQSPGELSWIVQTTRPDSSLH